MVDILAILKSVDKQAHNECFIAPISVTVRQNTSVEVYRERSAANVLVRNDFTSD